MTNLNETGMFPKYFPKEWMTEPKRKAEKIVYQALQLKLSKVAKIFYNRNWTNEEGYDGEADFIIAMKNFGIIVAEVKGGEVKYNANYDLWTTTNDIKIKNPIEQAKKSKYFILNQLREHNEKPFIIHICIFPSINKKSSPKNFGANIPNRLVAYKDDLDTIDKFVLKIFMNNEKYSPRFNLGLSSKSIKILNELLAKDFVLKNEFKTYIQDKEIEIGLLSIEQKKYLDIFNKQNRSCFEGGAGTGKTTLAIEKAKQLKEKTLFLCFNVALANYIKDKLADYPHIHIFNIDKFITLYSKNKNISNKSQTYWNILEDKDWDPYFNIIIDEGQDFEPNLWEPISMSLKDDYGIFWIFYDANQNLYRNRIDEINKIIGKPNILIENYRNTREIFNCLKEFYTGQKYISKGPEGFEINYIEKNNKDIIKVIENELNKLIINENIPPKMIGIITTCSLENSPFKDIRKIGNHKIINLIHTNNEAITLDSVHKFKGLEKPIIIFYCDEKYSDWKELIYVGISRAKSALTIISSNGVLNYIKK